MTGGTGGVFLRAAGEQDTHVGENWVRVVVPDMSGIKINLQLLVDILPIVVSTPGIRSAHLLTEILLV